MSKPGNDDQPAAAAPSKRAKLEALMFTGAAFGTALLTLAGSEVKLPPFKNE